MKKILLSLVLCGVLYLSSYAQTPVSGTISIDSTWTEAQSPIIINGTLQINSGVTLTIESNTEIWFESGAGMLIYGTINAVDAQFTSASEGNRRKGDWNTMEFRDGSEGIFSQCVFEYGGRSSTSMNYGMIYANGGTLSFDNNSVISNSNNTGLLVRDNSTVDIHQVSMLSNTYPLVYSGPADVSFDHDQIGISGNTHDGIFLNFTYLSSFMHLDTISVPYVFNRTMNIQSSGELEIAAGNVLKFNNSGITVHGRLKAIAEGGVTTYFTSYENDNLMGDTNNDGTATSPSSRDWRYIKFESGSEDDECILRGCNFSFGGSGNQGVVWLDNAGSTIDSCDFNNNYIGCEMENHSTPLFTKNTIGSSELVPLALTFDADPTFEDNAFSFSDNQYDAIGILGNVLTSNAHLPQRDVTGIPNVTYLMLGRVTIPEERTLSIAPGIVIKGYSSNHRLIVQGSLIMNGGDEANRITITSVKDDNFGNPSDTNKDGTSTEPSIGDWGGIVFEGTSDDESCIINYCRLQYGRLPSVYYNTERISGGTISMVNSSPTITNNIIKDCNYGIYAFQSSHPVITGNELSNTVYTPIALSVSANPSFSNNTFVNEGWSALGVIGEELGFNGTLSQRTVAGHNNITYVLMNNLTVNSGTNLDIDPGVVLKFDNNTSIYVDGGFKAQGTEKDSIIFTSIHDDNYGVPKDTRNDGDETSPSRGDWRTINYRSTANDAYNIIEYAKLLFGGSSNNGMVTYTNAGGIITKTAISDSYGYGLKIEGASTPDCSSEVTISNCRYDPIAMSLTSDPVMSFTSPDFASRGNGSNGILILEGTLNISTTLSQRDVGGIYNIAYIVDQLTIGSGATLTLEPGVVIKLLDRYSRVDINGALHADGEEENPIVFTSIKDDSKGGDTNNDGNDTNPERNDWYRIKFNASDLEANNLLRHCIVNYGGRTTGWNNAKNRSMVIVENAYAVIDSCELEHCRYTGLGIFGSANPVVSNNTFANIDETPVVLSMFSTPEFSGNSVSNIGITALGVAQENYSLDATIPRRTFAGFENITYYTYRYSTVNSGTIIEIPAGTVFKTDSYGSFAVSGALKSNGTSDNPVVFTHVNDDMYGNPADTGEDGSESSPSILNRPAIVYNDISMDAESEVNHTVFRYHSSGVDLHQAAPIIDNSLFEYCEWGIELKGVSEPVVTNNQFINLTYAPLYTSLVSYPSTASGNQLSGTTYRAIGVLANEELVQDVTLQKRDFAEVENIPYYFHGNYSIGTSVVLTIDPGVVCKFNRNARLTVKRGLMAIGGPAPDENIVFTDIRDDFYGGDTNSDGSASDPATNYPWQGIVFADESYDNFCRLEHSIILYAGYSNSHAAITTETASPTILNSSIRFSANGVKATGASNPLINHCDISDNRYYGVENVNKAFTIDATNNFWGSNTGPTHTSNPGGTGDAITDQVDYMPFLTDGFSLPVMGDVSLNGIVQAYDASLILQHVVELITLSDAQQQVANVDGDAENLITAHDASLVLQYVAGLINTFPAELKSGSIPLAIKTTNYNIPDLIIKPTETFSLPIQISNAKGIRSVDAIITYNPAVIEITNVQPAKGSEALTAVNINQEKGILKLAIAAAEDITRDDVLVHINGTAKGLENTSTPLTFATLLQNGINVSESVNQGLVTVQSSHEIIQAENYELKVYPVYPNPVNDVLHVQYEINREDTPVKIEVYDTAGNLIKQALNSIQKEGAYEYPVEGFSHLQGTFIVRIKVGNIESRQTIMVR